MIKYLVYWGIDLYMTIRNMNRPSVEDELNVSLSDFHKEFIDFKTGSKITTDPTDMLFYGYQDERSDNIPNTISGMMKNHENNKLKKGKPWGDFLIEFDKGVNGDLKSKLRKMCHLFKLGSVVKPHNFDNNGRVRFAKFVIHKVGIDSFIRIYHSDRGDVYTLAAMIDDRNSPINEDDLTIEQLKRLDQIYFFSSSRVEELNNDDKKEPTEEIIDKVKETDTNEEIDTDDLSENARQFISQYEDDSEELEQALQNEDDLTIEDKESMNLL